MPTLRTFEKVSNRSDKEQMCQKMWLKMPKNHFLNPFSKNWSLDPKVMCKSDMASRFKKMVLKSGLA